MYNRVCPHCSMDRIPEIKRVKQKGHKYVVYTCRVCKKHDIERAENLPALKYWNGHTWEDEAYFEEG